MPVAHGAAQQPAVIGAAPAAFVTANGAHPLPGIGWSRHAGRDRFSGRGWTEKSVPGLARREAVGVAGQGSKEFFGLAVVPSDDLIVCRAVCRGVAVAALGAGREGLGHVGSG